MELTEQLRNNFRKYTEYEPTMLFCEQCKKLLPVTLQGISFIHDELEMELSSTINEILDFLLISHYNECGKKALCDINSVSIIRKPERNHDSFQKRTGFKYSQYYGDNFKLEVNWNNNASDDEEDTFNYGCIVINVFPNKIKQD